MLLLLPYDFGRFRFVIFPLKSSCYVQEVSHWLLIVVFKGKWFKRNKNSRSNGRQLYIQKKYHCKFGGDTIVFGVSSRVQCAHRIIFAWSCMYMRFCSSRPHFSRMVQPLRYITYQQSWCWCALCRSVHSKSVIGSLTHEPNSKAHY